MRMVGTRFRNKIKETFDAEDPYCLDNQFTHGFATSLSSSNRIVCFSFSLFVHPVLISFVPIFVFALIQFLLLFWRIQFQRFIWWWFFRRWRRWLLVVCNSIKNRPRFLNSFKRVCFFKANPFPL